MTYSVKEMLSDVEVVSELSDEQWKTIVERTSPSFLQTPSWNVFQQDVGNSVLPIHIFHKGRPLLVSWTTRLQMRFGMTMLRCSFGPIFDPSVYEDVDLLVALLNDWIQEVRSSCVDTDVVLRIEPGVDLAAGHVGNVRDAWSQLDAVSASRPSSPVHTSIVSLGDSHDEHLKRMHSKARYNVRLAYRKGVQVRSGAQYDELNAFLALHHETAVRQGFTGHTDVYYERMLDVLGVQERSDCFTEVFLAEQGGDVLAGAIVIYTPTRATYLHGASSEHKRNLMAPHALHDTIIQRAREYGCSEYDFWGVAPADAGKGHPWAGISRFKRGFGGRDVSVLMPYDVPLHFLKYRVLRLLKK